MKQNLQIGLIGSYGNKPLDIALPIINEEDFRVRPEIPGHCFRIYDLNYTKIFLFSKTSDGTRRTAFIDIRSSCKANSNVSLYVVKMNNGNYYLRSYIDADHNGIYPMPRILTN